MRRHNRKKAQSNETSLKDKNKAPNMHSAKNKPINETVQEYYDEDTRKHKKKCKDTKLTLWEGVILLLLLKEKGLLDGFIEMDEYEEFDENEYKEFNIKSKHSPEKDNKNINKETHENRNSSLKNHYDFDYFSED